MKAESQVEEQRANYAALDIDETTPMPKSVHCVKDTELRVYLQNQFQPRRVAFTSEAVMFSWSGGENVIDLIPTNEITEVSLARHEDWANPEDKEEIEFWDTTEKRTKRISKFVHTKGHEPREFKICTIPDGYNSGHRYILQATTEEEVEEWITLLTEVAKAAAAKWRKKNRIKRFQSRLSAWFKSDKVQLFIALMILCNFVQVA